jgi:hypothetical protein
MYLIEIPPRLDRRDRRSNSRISLYALRLNIKFMKVNLKNISLVLIREIRGKKIILKLYFCELKI